MLVVAVLVLVVLCAGGAGGANYPDLDSFPENKKEKTEIPLE